MKKYYYRTRGLAAARAATLARALQPNTWQQNAQAAQLRRRALLRRSFNRWRTVTRNRSIRTNAMARSIIRLAMARRWRR